MKETSQPRYINRELSWLEFNARVLDEAADKGTPLLEKLKFLAIFSSNLDEFVMVRLAGIRQQVSGKSVAGYDPKALLTQLRTRIRTLVKRQYNYFSKNAKPALTKHGIELVSYQDLNRNQQLRMRKYFDREIYPVLTPIGVDPSHPFPRLRNLGLQILVRLMKKDDTHEAFAIIEVPDIIPRFIRVDNRAGRNLFITAEDLISANLETLITGCTIRESGCFRITRDMDFFFDEDSVADLLSELQIELQKTAKRKVIRMEIASKMTIKSRRWLQKNLDVEPENIYTFPEILDLKGLFNLIGQLDFPELQDQPLPQLPSVRIDPDTRIHESIRQQGSLLLHHPYESFSPVVRLLNEAADDPKVLAIKQTLYRVSGNSPIVKALARAARNGKQVSVLIELKARFDEENNIVWAQQLAEAGVNVIYGIAKLKVHCKALLIIRKEGVGIRRYVHLATGNYNDKTAKLYTDLGMMSDDPLLTADISALFNVITGFSQPPEWNKVMVAPFNLRERITYLIKREAKLSTPQNPGHIIIKINSLIDDEIIDCLYAAAKKNVKIELIVRGICGINPDYIGKDGKNIRVVSVIDRFLEHSRIYYFSNNGSEEYFIGSADCMPRNLSRRIELLFPVDKPELQRELDDILKFGLQDRRKGRRMIGPNKYSRTVNSLRYERSRSQTALYNYYQKRYNDFKEQQEQNLEIKVFKTPASNSTDQGS